jgi:hypothetical protein
MKFSANKAILVKAPAPVEMIATTAIKQDHADAFKFILSAKQTSLSAGANNGYVAIDNTLSDWADIDYKCESPGDVTLKVADFDKVMTAFRDDETLEISVDGNSLVFHGKSEDADEVMTMLIEPTTVVMPTAVTKFNQEISINRAYLIKALDKILFAVGFEKYRRHFLYWKLRNDKDGARFVAGDGGRFVAYTLRGADIVKSAGDLTMCFYGAQTQEVLPKLLPKFETVNDVVIKSYSGNKDDVPDQIVINLGPATLVLTGHDSDVNWPDEDRFLRRTTNNYKFTTSLGDWQLAVAGVSATFNKEMQKATEVHTAEMIFDLKAKTATVKANSAMKAVKKVKLINTKIVDGSPTTVSFRCTSGFLGEMYKYGNRTGHVQIEMVGPNDPLVVRYYGGEAVEDNADEIKDVIRDVGEQYAMFFAPSNVK